MFTVAKTLQDALVARLKTFHELQGVPVIGRRKGNIVNDIEAAVGNLGACLYVYPALPTQANADLPGPYATVEVRVRVIEDPAMNTKLPDAYELTEIVLTRLHEASFRDVEALAGINPLQCLPQPVEEVPDDNRCIFDVTFTTSLGLPQRN